MVKGTVKCANCGGMNQPRFVAEGSEIVHRYMCDSAKCDRDRQEIVRRAARHGISFDQYSEIHLRQGGRCPVCAKHLGRFDRDIVIDHDHACCPKGTSCGACELQRLHLGKRGARRHALPPRPPRGGPCRLRAALLFTENKVEREFLAARIADL